MTIPQSAGSADCPLYTRGPVPTTDVAGGYDSLPLVSPGRRVGVEFVREKTLLSLDKGVFCALEKENPVSSGKKAAFRFPPAKQKRPPTNRIRTTVAS